MTRRFPAGVVAAVLGGRSGRRPCRGAGARFAPRCVAGGLRASPALRVSDYEAAIADAELERAESALDPVFGLRLGVSDDRSPVLSGFQPSESRTAVITGTLNQALGSGGDLGVTVDYSRTRQQFDTPFAAQLALLNPAYRGGVAVNYRHPLFRGAGRIDYRETLAIAATGIETARLQHHVLLRALMLQTLEFYFRLLADEIGIGLADGSLDRARRLVEHQRFRERFGLIDAAERMQSEALLAARALELQRAQAQARASRVALNRLMLRDVDAPLQPVAPPAQPGAPTLEDAVSQAVAVRPELQLLQRELEIAEAHIRMVRETTRPQLDLIVEAGVFALDREPLDASSSIRAIGFRPVGGAARYARPARRARWTAGRGTGTKRLIARRQQLSEQLRDELSVLHVTLHSVRNLAPVRQRACGTPEIRGRAERYRDGRSDRRPDPVRGRAGSGRARRRAAAARAVAGPVPA